MGQGTTVQSLSGVLSVDFKQTRQRVMTVAVRLHLDDNERLMLLPSDNCTYGPVTVMRHTNGWGSHISIKSTVIADDIDAVLTELHDFFLVVGHEMRCLVHGMLTKQCYMYWEHNVREKIELSYTQLDGVSRFLAIVAV